MAVAEEPFIDVSVDIGGQVKRRNLAEPKAKTEAEGQLNLGIWNQDT